MKQKVTTTHGFLLSRDQSKNSSAAGMWTRVGNVRSTNTSSRCLRCHQKLTKWDKWSRIQAFLTEVLSKAEGDIWRDGDLFWERVCQRTLRLGELLPSEDTRQHKHVCRGLHTLKEVYLERKQNRQVDHLLYKLRKISRDKAFEQWLKAEKGRWQWGNGKTWRHTNTQSQLQQKRCRERTWIVERCHHWMIKGKSTACDESRHHSVPAFSDALPVWLAFTSLTARGLTTLSLV